MSAKLNAEIAVIGIDIGKNSFHIVGLDRRARSCCARSGPVEIVPWSTLCRADWVRDDPVLTTRGCCYVSTTQFLRELREAMRQRANIREYRWGRELDRVGTWASRRSSP